MTRKPVAVWGNRVIGMDTVPANQLLANERNWRVHGQDQQTALGSLLHDVGFIQCVVVNKRTSSAWGRDRGVETLVDGHLRVQLALSRGEDTPVPVLYVDLGPEEERRALLTMDPIGALAGRDKDKMAELATDVLTDWPELDDADLAAILKSERKATKGLTHTVHECRCCRDRCRVGCGCYVGKEEVGDAEAKPRLRPRRSKN